MQRIVKGLGDTLIYRELKKKTSIPSVLRLYLFRHGETEWSLTGQHTGITDVGLTSHGEYEARELGKHLREIRFSPVLTSANTKQAP